MEGPVPGLIHVNARALPDGMESPHVWAPRTALGNGVCCAPSPMPRRKHGQLTGLLCCDDESRVV